MEMAKPVLGYWNLRGICQPVRFIAAYAGLEIVEKKYALDASGMEAWGKDKFNLGLDFPNLPYWVEGGETLTESRAILKHIAREKTSDLMPKDPILLSKADMVENVLFDAWMALTRRLHQDSEDTIANLENNIPKKLEQLVHFMGNNNFILGKITYVDFLLYEMLVGYSRYDANFLKPYPKLLEFMADFEALPAIAKHIQSPEYVKGPCFHPVYMSKVKIEGLTQ